MLKHIFRVFVAPFTERMPLLIALVVLGALPETVYNFDIHIPLLTAYIVFDNLLIAYALLLPLYFIKGKFGKIYAGLITVFYAIWALIDVFCMATYGVEFNDQHSEIIRQTTLAESSEFISEYFSASIVLHWIGVLAAAKATYFLVKRFAGRHPKAETICGLAALLLSIAAMSYRPEHFYKTPVGKTYLFKYPDVPDLHDYLSHPDVTATGKRPERIVVIIGESFARTHSSLYGYEMPTNPRLEKLVADSSLIVFTDVDSPATQTLDCFKLFMSLNPGDLADDAEWYKYTTLPELLHQGGYYLRWTSNQGDKSRFDMIPSQYASLCDTVLYKTDSPLYHQIKTLDEVLLPIARQFEAEPRTPAVDFYHLQGSHCRYSRRCPADRLKFTPDQYTHIEEPIRNTTSLYDNTILYNDSVVNEIISTYRDDECIVIYFSDHGLDFFDIDYYHGHGRPGVEGSEEAARRIPFMVYVSDRFRAKYPEKVAYLRAISGQKFNTTNFPEFLLNAANLKYCRRFVL